MHSIIPIEDVNIQGSTITNIVTDSSITVIYNEANRSVNNNFCNISSLGVYRGREQTIMISHDGFSLSDNGTIEVDN